MKNSKIKSIVKLSAVLASAIILTGTAFAESALTARPEGIGRPGGIWQQSMMQEMLNLTDEQVTAMQAIRSDGQKELAEIFESHGLKQDDMKKLRLELKKFRQGPIDDLKAELSMEELSALRDEIFKVGPLAFSKLSEDEKLSRLQDSLGFSEVKAVQVTAIIDAGKAQRESTLEDLGFNTEQITAFHQDMAAQRESMKQSLSKILSAKQMERFEDILQYRMQQGHRGHGRPFFGGDK